MNSWQIAFVCTGCWFAATTILVAFLIAADRPHQDDQR